MLEKLARELLGKTLSWDEEKFTKEQPFFDILSKTKYDEYQQFKPGWKFVESLAIWLQQFTQHEERTIAYQFIKNNLIFISSAEMDQLVDITYNKVVNPILLKAAAQEAKLNYWQFKRIINTLEYQQMRRRTLFLGMSDGARLDRFRRMNDLSNEQVYTTYEISAERSRKLVESLRKDLAKIKGVSEGDISREEATFRFIFLIDDFSGSGLSIIRENAGDWPYAGKLSTIYKNLFDVGAPFGNAIDINNLEIHTLLYIMTEKARQHVSQLGQRLWNHSYGEFKVETVLILNDSIRLNRGEDTPLDSLIQKYYDPKAEDEHTRVGNNEDLRYGFADVGLPLVMVHNTPNNSLYLLWGYTYLDYQGLFPRVSRHREK